jgi:hypothetical protein
MFGYRGRFNWVTIPSGEIFSIDIVGGKGVIAGDPIFRQKYVHSSGSPIDIPCGSLLQVFFEFY